MHLKKHIQIKRYRPTGVYKNMFTFQQITDQNLHIDFFPSVNFQNLYKGQPFHKSHSHITLKTLIT